MPAKKITVDVLVEGNGGELVFQPITVSAKDVKKLLLTKNSMIKSNLKKELKLRD